jgi:hypothetical protein
MAGGRNLIVNPDTGTDVQVAIYSGAGSDCWPCGDPNCDTGWNAVQAGNACNVGSGFQAASSDGSTIYTRTQPLQWDPDRGRSNVIIEQWVSLPAANVVKMEYKVTNNETMTIGGRTHEWPVAYLDGTLVYPYTYDGGSPWTYDTPTLVNVPVPDGITFTSTEPWIAWDWDDGAGPYGVTLYVPTSQAHDTWGMRRWTPSGSVSRSILQNWGSWSLDPGQSVTLTAYLITGPLSDARAQVYAYEGH